jgi:hypothetical protein
VADKPKKPEATLPSASNYPLDSAGNPIVHAKTPVIPRPAGFERLLANNPELAKSLAGDAKGAQSSEKAAVTEAADISGHKPLPKNWIEAVPAILFGFYGLAFASEAVSAMNRGDIGIAIANTAGCALCAAVSLAWWKRRDWLPQKLVATSTGIVTDARWLLGALSALLIVSALAPYIEERRWPYADWLKPAPAPIVTNRQPAPTDDVAKLTAERDKALKELNDSKHELDIARKAAIPAPLGTVTLNSGEIGAVLLLNRLTSTEIISRSTNIKAAEIETGAHDLSNAALAICTVSCITVRIIFDGSYGPFDVSIQDTTSIFSAGAMFAPKLAIVRAGDSFLDVVVEPGTGMTLGSDLRELRISIHKRTY